MSGKSERLFACMNGISDRVIDEAGEESPIRHRRFRWKRWTALAAALALVIGLGSQLLPRMGGGTSGGAGGSGSEGTSTFMSYAGPVFPLTLREENAAVTAQRELTLDFAPWVPVWISNEESVASRDWLTGAERQELLDDYNEWYPEGGRYQSSTDILVTDSYTLVNSSDADQTVTVLYPFASSLRDLWEDRPVLTADGQEKETVLYAGGYSGGFMGVWGGTLFTEESEGSVNLDQLTSWEGYKALLSDGSYLERTLGGYPDLTGVPVTVYEFTDPWGPERDEDNGIPNPTIRVEFDLDYSETVVLSYGFNGIRTDEEAGRMAQQFSIPRPGYRDYGRSYYLIVLGEDIQNLTTQGYNTGGWDTTKTVETGVTVRRYESSLDAALRTVAGLEFQDWQEDQAGEDSRMAGVDFEMYYGLFCEYLASYGLLAEEPVERYDQGWLEFTDFESVDRVFYLEAEVTLPAGGSVELAAEMVKKGSYDFYCAHTENQGVYGYDLVTQLGSNLICTAQTATLEDRGQIEIVRQNLGFDLEEGVKTVALDGEREHYCLEVRRLETEK